MRIALYVENDYEQIVLTPETETEKQLLAKLTDASRIVSIKQGGFYYCRGGWVREQRNDAPDSTMLVMEPPQDT